MAKKEKSKLLSLVEVAFNSADAKEKYGMKIGDHKLICNVLDCHMEVMKQETDKQNEKFREELIKDVVEVITNELRPIKGSLVDIQKDMTALRGQVSELKHNQEKLAKEVEDIKKVANKPIIYLRLFITAVVTSVGLYFLIKYAHDHWWLNNLISLWR